MAHRYRILFSGMAAADPHQGGATWAVLQYVLGLRELGHEVLFVEPMPERKALPIGATLETSSNGTYFQNVVEEFGLQGDAALLLSGTQKTLGLCYDELRRRARGCDLLINVSGMLNEPDLTESIAVR